jgi:LuxR family maltose regulon positive regulatory protein
MTQPVAIGLSCCYLVSACERIRDFARAEQWCRRVRDFCERTRFQFLLAVCRTQYAGVLTWRGSWAEAERELQAVLDELGATRPALRHEALVRLADLRRQQGRLDEAGALLKQVDGSHLSGILSRAALALEQGDPSSALPLARRFLRRLPPLSLADRMMGLDVLLRAQVAAGDREASRTTLDELRSIAATMDIPAVKAIALMGEGMIASSESAHAEARVAFEDALDLLARSGAAVEMARCRVELARVVAAMGDRDTAAAELREAVRGFEPLGSARHLATATGLLRDLQRAVTTPSNGLTRREIEVLRLVARGLSNGQIAKQLGVSPFTVKRHVGNVLTKLDLASRAAAAAFAVRKGLT